MTANEPTGKEAPSGKLLRNRQRMSLHCYIKLWCTHTMRTLGLHISRRMSCGFEKKREEQWGTKIYKNMKAAQKIECRALTYENPQYVNSRVFLEICKTPILNKFLTVVWGFFTQWVVKFRNLFLLEWGCLWSAPGRQKKIQRDKERSTKAVKKKVFSHIKPTS